MPAAPGTSDAYGVEPFTCLAVGFSGRPGARPVLGFVHLRRCRRRAVEAGTASL